MDGQLVGGVDYVMTIGYLPKKTNGERETKPLISEQTRPQAARLSVNGCGGSSATVRRRPHQR